MHPYSPHVHCVFLCVCMCVCHPTPCQEKVTVLKQVSSLFKGCNSVQVQPAVVRFLLYCLIICNAFLANAILDKKPSLLTPAGARSNIKLVKGEDLKLECIAEGM